MDVYFMNLLKNNIKIFVALLIIICIMVIAFLIAQYRSVTQQKQTSDTSQQSNSNANLSVTKEDVLYLIDKSNMVLEGKVTEVNSSNNTFKVEPVNSTGKIYTIGVDYQKTIFFEQSVMSDVSLVVSSFPKLTVDTIVFVYAPKLDEGVFTADGVGMRVNTVTPQSPDQRKTRNAVPAG